MGVLGGWAFSYERDTPVHGTGEGRLRERPLQSCAAGRTAIPSDDAHDSTKLVFTSHTPQPTLSDQSHAATSRTNLLQQLLPIILELAVLGKRGERLLG